MNETLLSVKHLSIGFEKNRSIKTVVSDISFDIKQGQILGIVGESGSGKSVTALSIMGLLSKSGIITKGSIVFSSQDLTLLSEKQYCKIRGSDIAMVFQEPMTSLNPVLTIGKQAEEMLLLHKKEVVKKEEYKQYVLSMFEDVGLKDAKKLYDNYPHELSGGMRQRVMIAIAMMCKPKLLIADEPTTALDVTLQLKILMLLKKLNEDYKTSILFISHDLSIIKKICSHAFIMYQGEILEQGTIEEVFTNPKKEYTKKLLSVSKKEELQSMSAKPHIISKIKSTFLTVDHLNVYYEEKKETLFGKKRRKQAVKDVSFHLDRGEVLGIVGESGCGKSSIAKAVVGLQKIWDGKINYTDENKVLPQMVFQDPYGSLNQSKKIGWLLEEPLRMQHIKNRKDQVFTLLSQVGLSKSYADCYPSELSGGQRQRVAIAIAIILNQKLIILDEPVSALDVSIQDQVLRLLKKLQNEYELSYIFITHDMNVVKRICDRVCVMYQGEIVEMQETRPLFLNPKHEYTKKLLGSVI